MMTEVRVSVSTRDSKGWRELGDSEGEEGIRGGGNGKGNEGNEERYYRDRFVREWGDPLGHGREGSETSLKTWCQGCDGKGGGQKKGG